MSPSASWCHFLSKDVFMYYCRCQLPQGQREDIFFLKVLLYRLFLSGLTITKFLTEFHVLWGRQRAYIVWVYTRCEGWDEQKCGFWYNLSVHTSLHIHNQDSGSNEIQLSNSIWYFYEPLSWFLVLLLSWFLVLLLENQQKGQGITKSLVNSRGVKTYTKH